MINCLGAQLADGGGGGGGKGGGGGGGGPDGEGPEGGESAGEGPPHVYSEAQQTPFVGVGGYGATSHARAHGTALLARVPRRLKRALERLQQPQNEAAPGDGAGRDQSAEEEGGKKEEDMPPERPLGSWPWPDWPVFGPKDCQAQDPLPPGGTAWDQHVARLKTPGAFSQTQGPKPHRWL